MSHRPQDFLNKNGLNRLCHQCKNEKMSKKTENKVYLVLLVTACDYLNFRNK